jgi:hypothetical protein
MEKIEKKEKKEKKKEKGRTTRKNIYLFFPSSSRSPPAQRRSERPKEGFL